MAYRQYFHKYQGQLSNGEYVVDRFHWSKNTHTTPFKDILLYSKDKFYFSCQKCSHYFCISIFDVVVNYMWCGCEHGKCVPCNKNNGNKLIFSHRQERQNQAKEEAKLKDERIALKAKIEKTEQTLIMKAEQEAQNSKLNEETTTALESNLIVPTVEKKDTKCLVIQSAYFNLSCNTCSASDIRDVHGCTNFSCTSCSHTMTNNGVFFHMRCQFCPTSCWFPASGFSNPDNYQCPCTKSSS